MLIESFITLRVGRICLQRTKCYGIFVNENRLILNIIFNIAMEDAL